MSFFTRSQYRWNRILVRRFNLLYLLRRNIQIVNDYYYCLRIQSWSISLKNGTFIRNMRTSVWASLHLGAI